MSAFKAKRVSGTELHALIGGVTAHMPPATPQAPAPTPASVPAQPAKAPRKLQVNFEASEAFADLIAREAARAGSTRRFFARLCRNAGYEVPEADVNPADNRRKRGFG
jgi:hypothetical protein